ncbi:hypothetical protein chiPu_0019372 [Chiloscyllium punctatum]|uniref:Uncharacterized protein n=1 Tax=Chiloscyllium punctatum TaxID=137246 RepID=A0A401RRN4_CHIPU|nr:hypothetical protein [Chiloscyllium punctatum]
MNRRPTGCTEFFGGEYLHLFRGNRSFNFLPVRTVLELQGNLRSESETDLNQNVRSVLLSININKRIGLKDNQGDETVVSHYLAVSKPLQMTLPGSAFKIKISFSMCRVCIKQLIDLGTGRSEEAGSVTGTETDRDET